MSFYRSSPPPSKQKSHAVVREIGLIAVVLLVATVAVVGGYVLANHSGGIFGKVLAIGQSTPVPSIPPETALNQIQRLIPGALVSVTSPLSDEVDLITSHVLQNATAPTTQLQTQILSLYIRGYAKQTFWRWDDEYLQNSTMVRYEVHASELWVINLRTTTCSQSWTVWSIAPADITTRGASGGDYTSGTTSHPGTGPLPDGLAGC